MKNLIFTALVLIVSSNLWAAKGLNESTQVFQPCFNDYMENVTAKLKCQANDEQCYRNSFEQTESCKKRSSSKNCITTCSYIAIPAMGPCRNNHELCQDAAKAFCLFYCNSEQNWPPAGILVKKVSHKTLMGSKKILKYGVMIGHHEKLWPSRNFI